MANKTVQIGNCTVGEGFPVMLLAEAGINHQGDLQMAKKLIDAASACHWHGIKFQKRVPELCVPESQKDKPKETPWGTMSYLEYKKRMEFGPPEYKYIKQYCEEKPIAWGASVWDIPSYHFMEALNPTFLKIPSAKLTDNGLLHLCAMSKLPLIVSTGMSTEAEVDTAVQCLEAWGKENYILLHTVSVYPAEYKMLNLRYIETMRKRYPCVIGYSGHESDLEPSVLAAAMGAKLIERHITLDNNLWGTDQKASLPVLAMDMLRKRIACVVDCLGDGVKRLLPEEVTAKEKLRG